MRDRNLYAKDVAKSADPDMTSRWCGYAEHSGGTSVVGE